MANANGKINAAVYEVNPAGSHGQTKLHLGVTVQEFRQNRRNKRHHKVCLGRHVQAAGWRVRKPTHRQSRLLHIRNDPACVPQIDITRLSEALLSRCSTKKPRTQLVLQLRYLTGYRRRSDP